MPDEILQQLIELTLNFQTQLQSSEEFNSDAAVALAKILFNILNTLNPIEDRFLLPIEDTLKNLLKSEKENDLATFPDNFMRHCYLRRIPGDSGCLFALLSNIPSHPGKNLIELVKEYIEKLKTMPRQRSSRSYISLEQIREYFPQMPKDYYQRFFISPTVKENLPPDEINLNLSKKVESIA